MKLSHVTDGFPIQFKTVRLLIMSEDFWDTLNLVTQVLKPVLVDLCYCDDMKGDTLTLLYIILFEIDTYYSKSIKGLDETIRTNLHVFMSRWSVIHAPVYSTAFAQDEDTV